MFGGLGGVPDITHLCREFSVGWYDSYKPGSTQPGLIHFGSLKPKMSTELNGPNLAAAGGGDVLPLLSSPLIGGLVWRFGL